MDAIGEFGWSEVSRKIIPQEQEHLIGLADALGIDNATLNDWEAVTEAAPKSPWKHGGWPRSRD